ncbi:MAG: BON domain-containing protein [Rubripirellula sp.]
MADSLGKLGDDFQISVECDESQGIVTLKGSVPTTGDRSFCGIVTRTIPGVRRVENLIEVLDAKK